MSRLYREVQIQGLVEFQHELLAARRAFPIELARADSEAAQLVAAGARRRAPRGPHLGGGQVQPIVDSIHAGISGRGGFVAIGGPGSPHAAPTEFGGTLRRHASQTRTQIRRQPFLYPTLAAESDAIDGIYLDAMERVVRRAFPGRALALA